MKSASLVTALTSPTTVMAIAAPVVVFGFLWALLVQPERAGAIEAQTELAEAEADLHRRRLSSSTTPVSPDAAAVDAFVSRAGQGYRVDEVVDALTGLLKSPVVGGVANLQVKTGAPGPAGTLITLVFDGQHDQVIRFLRAVGSLPPAVSVPSIEIAADPFSEAALKHANVSFLVSHVRDAALPPLAERRPKADLGSTPRRDAVVASPRASAAPPDPVVSGILVSNGRRVARVDGRIVRSGDRVQAGIIKSIEPGAIVIVDSEGRERRIEIQRRVIGMPTR